MTLQSKAPPHKREGAVVRLPDRAKTKTSGASLARKSLAGKTPAPAVYNGYHLFCYWPERDQWIYEPPDSMPMRVYCFLIGWPDSSRLVALTPHEVAALDDDIAHKLSDALLGAEEMRGRDQIEEDHYHITDQDAADRAADAADAEAKEMASESLDAVRVRHLNQSLAIVEHAMGLGGEA